MVRVVWTDGALVDLEAIAAYIAKDSFKYAQITIERIYLKALVLKEFPKIGSIVPEKDQENIRQLFEGNYRIIYRVSDETTIHILSIYHSARLLK